MSHTGPTAMASTSPARQSSTKREIPVKAMKSNPEASDVMPESSSSRSASRSEVCRAMIRPEV